MLICLDTVLVLNIQLITGMCGGQSASFVISNVVTFVIYNFSYCVISHKSVQNINNYWSLEENEVIKM